MIGASRESFSDKIFYLLNGMIQKFTELFKQSPRSFCSVETIDEDGRSIIYKDGTMASFCEIHGGIQTIGSEEFDELVVKLSDAISSNTSDGGHYVSLFFSRDPDGIEREVESLVRGSRVAAEKMDLDIGDILDEHVKVMSSYTQVEKCYLIMYSTLDGMSADERSKAITKKMEYKGGIPFIKDAQDIGAVIPDLRARHSSFVNSISSDFRAAGLVNDVMPVHDVIRAMRSSTDPEWTSDDWKASLPGDPLPIRFDDSDYADLSKVFWPTIESQVFPREAENITGAIVRIGDRLLAPISMELGPRKVESFQVLFRRLNREQIPWRISYKIMSNGTDIMSMRASLASLMEFTPGTTNNKWLLAAQRDITDLRDTGFDIAKLQICLSTWGPVGDMELIEKRKAILARCVQGWGNCDVAQAEGDALETFISSGPGISKNNIGQPMAAPLIDACQMLPITRPSSPFKTGSRLFRSPDGKILPYQANSKLQTAWLTLYLAPMGYGKSVAMNTDNLSLILSADLDELPFISIIDIGPSSKGLIDLIQGALPEGKKHYASYDRLKNTREYAINVFDTLLGLRFPLSNHRGYLVNFLCYLATPLGQDSPYDGVQGIADAVVTQVYKDGAARKTAKTYTQKINAQVDDALATLDFEADVKTTKWWDVVDLLYKEGMPHEASLAQRYAVPTLVDIAQCAQSDKVKTIYNGTTKTNEEITTYFWRVMTEMINIYPLIGEPTRFDLGEARIVSLDLDQVAKGDGADAKKRTGLMYMLAYHALTSKFFLGEEHLDEMAESVGMFKIDYRPYHGKFIDSIKKLPKRFCADEKHRVKGLTLIESMFLTAVREGRKWKTEICLASQLPEDFGEEMVQLATSIFILGSGSNNNADAVKKEFRLTDTMDYHLRNSIRKPAKSGSNMLAIISTTEGQFMQLVTSTIGPTVLWAFNSSSDDSYIRNKIAGKIGAKPTRALLVKYYPGGSCDDDIERRKNVLSTLSEDKAKDMLEEGGASGGILNDIITELLDKHEVDKFKASRA